MAMKINQAIFEQEVEQGKKACLVDFYADWCGPCQMLGPIMEELAQAGYPIYQVNVDEEKELAMRFQVLSIPTLILFKDGEAVERLVGLQSKKTLQEKLDYYGLQAQ